MVRRSVGIAALLVPLVAAAGWTTIPTTGTPTDVQALDAGVVVFTSTGVGSTAAAWWVAPDGGVGTIASLTGAFAGATLMTNGCLVGMTPGKVVQGSAACAALTSPSCAGCTAATRFRTAPGGTTLALLTSGPASAVFFQAPSPLGPWTSPGVSWTNPVLPSSPALSMTRVPDVDVAVFNTANLTPQVGVSIDGGAPSWPGVGTNLRDVVAFSSAGLPSALGLTTAGGLVLLEDVRLPSALPTGLSLPGGVSPAFIAFTSSGGNAQGEGFGLITTSGGQVLSPIPDPSRLGREWIVRGGAPALSSRVSCAGPDFCAAVGVAGTLAVYFNLAAPTLALPAEIAIAPGATVTVTADAGDADDDPLFVTWAPTGPVTLGARDGGDGRLASLSVPASAAACADVVVPVAVTVSDGLAAHVISGGTQVRIPRAVPVASAFVTPTSIATWAGGPAALFSVSADAGCAPTGFSWSTTDGLNGVGTNFSWSPPATLCAADGGVVGVDVIALDPTANSLPSHAQVEVAPWGAPLPPTFTAGATQAAGTSATWSPVNSEHACSTTTGFPGVTLEWSQLDAGAGIWVTPVDGGLLVDVPDRCTAGTVIATASRRVVGEAHGLKSPDGTLRVDVLPQATPTGPGTPFSMGLRSDGGLEVGGRLWADAGCVDPKALSANIQIERPDASVAFRGVFSVPADWSLALVPECLPAPYRAVARLRVDGGFVGAVDQASFSFEPWGAPAAPVLPASTTQPAGASQFYPVNLPVHACVAAPGFPGLALAWSSFDAGSGVTLRLVDGGFEVASNDWCASAQVLVAATAEVSGASTPASATASATITVVPQGDPVGPGTPFSMHLVSDGGGELGGVFTIDAGCGVPAGLTAYLEAFRPDASVVAGGRWAVPGAWSLQVAPSCEAQELELVARLESGGLAVGAVDRAFARVAALPQAPPTPLAIEASASCGEVAAIEVRWPGGTQACGFTPATARLVSDGGVTLTVRADGTLVVDGGVEVSALVGQVSEIEVTASNGLTARASVSWRVAPYVSLSAVTLPVAMREEELMEVPITLQAPACGADPLEPRGGGHRLPDRGRHGGRPGVAGERHGARLAAGRTPGAGDFDGAGARRARDAGATGAGA